MNVFGTKFKFELFDEIRGRLDQVLYCQDIFLSLKQSKKTEPLALEAAQKNYWDELKRLREHLNTLLL